MTQKDNAASADLWKALSSASTADEIAGPWLDIQAGWIPGFQRGAVMLRSSRSGKFLMLARRPADDDDSGERMQGVADRAVAENKGVVQRHVLDDGSETGHLGLAYPLNLEGKIVGVVVVEVTDQGDDALRNILRQIQWGKVWLEHKLLSEQLGHASLSQGNSQLVLEAFAALMDADDSHSGIQAATMLLAHRMGCDRISVGFPEKGYVKVEAISHAFRMGARQDLVRGLGDAMDEAADQGLAILVHSGDKAGPGPVTEAHRRHLGNGETGHLLSIPVFSADALVGCMAFEWPEADAPDDEQRKLAEGLANLLLPVLAERRASEDSVRAIALRRMKGWVRSFAEKGYMGRKLGWSAVVFAIFLGLVVTGEFRVTADARLEGSVQRSIVAAIDGYVLSQHARPGDVVSEGQVLARLDNKDLILERLRWTAQKKQYEAEAAEALALHNRAGANVARAQMTQADAQIALINEQLKRTVLQAPFAGIVVSGDLSQSVGAAVRRGDLLFEVAPLKAYRVVLFVDESDIGHIVPGQRGILVTPARPDDALSFEITRITPLSEAREGKNLFRVEASTDAGQDWIQPGLEGVAKISIGRRRSVWIWTHRFTNWLRLTLWTWWP